MGTILEYPTQGTVGTSLRPKRFDIEMYQGDTMQFYLQFNGTGLDVTGWTATSTVKKVSDSTVVASVITIDAIDTLNKRFLIHIDSDLLDPAVTYKYDIQVVNGTEKRTFIGGNITLTEDITEP
jgi:hypothetical protein